MYYPSNSFDATGGLCFGKISTVLNIDPQTGPNTERYDVVARFVNASGLIGQSKADFKVEFKLGSGSWTRVRKFKTIATPSEGVTGLLIRKVNNPSGLDAHESVA
jgi:hypothetical protein